MPFALIPQSYNSDATTTYDVQCSFPISFQSLLKQVLMRDERDFIIGFSISYRYTYSRFKDVLEFNKNKNDNEWHIVQSAPPNGLYEKLLTKTVFSCWANGGYGQMWYYITVGDDEHKSEYAW